MEASLWDHSDRIALHLLPSYGPDRNPIERVWWHLHGQVTRNHRCRSMQEWLDRTFDRPVGRTRPRSRAARSIWSPPDSLPLSRGAILVTISGLPGCPLRIDPHDRHHRLRDGQPPERAEGDRGRRPSGRGDRTPNGSASHVILPGVGAFADAAAELRRTGLGEAFREAVRAGKPCLGVCLGLQLLFDVSEEDGEHQGLGLLPGRVVRFASAPGLKIPHMGWNTLRIRRPAPLLAGLGPEPSVYFVHSYHAVADRPDDVAAESDHPGPFAAIGLAREPDGLPVPPREEPAGRPGDVRQLRRALERS